ncbi:MAG: hypothetical protein PHT95_07120, partial [Candidatus Omnitrophica bacterium]|nr:hypothetical protein [Candidatus Omnitrophota bacterium]
IMYPVDEDGRIDKARGTRYYVREDVTGTKEANAEGVRRFDTSDVKSTWSMRDMMTTGKVKLADIPDEYAFRLIEGLHWVKEPMSNGSVRVNMYNAEDELVDTAYEIGDNAEARKEVARILAMPGLAKFRDLPGIMDVIYTLKVKGSLEYDVLGERISAKAPAIRETFSRVLHLQGLDDTLNDLDIVAKLFYVATRDEALGDLRKELAGMEEVAAYDEMMSYLGVTARNKYGMEYEDLPPQMRADHFLEKTADVAKRKVSGGLNEAETKIQIDAQTSIAEGKAPAIAEMEAFRKMRVHRLFWSPATYIMALMVMALLFLGFRKAAASVKARMRTSSPVPGGTGEGETPGEGTPVPAGAPSGWGKTPIEKINEALQSAAEAPQSSGEAGDGVATEKHELSAGSLVTARKWMLALSMTSLLLMVGSMVSGVFSQNLPLLSMISVSVMAGVSIYSMAAFIKFSSIRDQIIEAIEMYNGTVISEEERLSTSADIARRMTDGTIEPEKAFYRYLSPMAQYNVYLHETFKNHFTGMLAMLPGISSFFRDRVQIPLEKEAGQARGGKPAATGYNKIIGNIKDIKGRLEGDLWKASLELEPGVYTARNRAVVVGNRKEKVKVDGEKDKIVVIAQIRVLYGNPDAEKKMWVLRKGIIQAEKRKVTVLRQGGNKTPKIGQYFEGEIELDGYADYKKGDIIGIQGELDQKNPVSMMGIVEMITSIGILMHGVSVFSYVVLGLGAALLVAGVYSNRALIFGAIAKKVSGKSIDAANQVKVAQNMKKALKKALDDLEELRDGTKARKLVSDHLQSLSDFEKIINEKADPAFFRNLSDKDKAVFNKALNGLRTILGERSAINSHMDIVDGSEMSEDEKNAVKEAFKDLAASKDIIRLLDIKMPELEIADLLDSARIMVRRSATEKGTMTPDDWGKLMTFASRSPKGAPDDHIGAETMTVDLYEYIKYSMEWLDEVIESGGKKYTMLSRPHYPHYNPLRGLMPTWYMKGEEFHSAGNRYGYVGVQPGAAQKKRITRQLSPEEPRNGALTYNDSIQAMPINNV